MTEGSYDHDRFYSYETLPARLISGSLSAIATVLWWALISAVFIAPALWLGWNHLGARASVNEQFGLAWGA